MKKIMFNDKYCLTQAVVDGKKTQTRRMIPSSVFEKWMDYDEYCDTVGGRMSRQDMNEFLLMHSKHLVGDIIAVAQSYNNTDGNPYLQHQQGLLPKDKLNAGWNNKMFVKADLMPHQIRITGVRVEKLQDISDEDCMKEGIRRGIYKEKVKNKWVDAYCIPNTNEVYYTSRAAFAALIDKVSGKGTWENNPFVWVYDFEIVK